MLPPLEGVTRPPVSADSRRAVSMPSGARPSCDVALSLGPPRLFAPCCAEQTASSQHHIIPEILWLDAAHGKVSGSDIVSGEPCARVHSEGFSLKLGRLSPKSRRRSHKESPRGTRPGTIRCCRCG